MRARILVFFAALAAMPLAGAEAQLASLLKDIQPTGGPAGSYPDFLGSVDGVTFFAASSPTIGRELWRTDGTPEGTRLASDTCPGSCGAIFRALAAGTSGSQLFLAGFPYSNDTQANALFVAAGAAPEIVRLEGAATGLTFPYMASSGATAWLSGRLYFWGNGDGVVRLLRTDAAGTGVELIHEFAQSSGLSELRSLASSVLFWNRTPEGPNELWATDGTSAGTRLVTALDLDPVAPSASLGGRWVIFTAIAGGEVEVWSTDGTAAGTHPLTAFPDPSAAVWEMKASSTSMFFFVQDYSAGQELWTSDGTVAGTRPVSSFGYHQPLGGYRQFDQLAILGPDAYFLATDGLGSADLWKATSAPFSATAILDACPDASCLETAWLTRAGTRLFFLAEDAEHGREVWTSDGTAAGSRILEDACVGLCWGAGSFLASNDQRFVYSVLNTTPFRYEVFVAEFPWNGAQSLFDPLRSAPALDPIYFGNTVLDGPWIYFPAKDAQGALEPWVSRGAPANTLQLADIVGPLYGDSRAHGFEAIDSRVAFLATDLDFVSRLWLTDGSTSGTRPSTGAGLQCYDPTAEVHALNGNFVHLDCDGNIEVVNPTTGVTTHVAAGAGCFPGGAEVAGGALAALLGCNYPQDLWRSDGTAAGTSFRFSFPADFYIGAFEPVGDRVVFVGGGSPTYRLYSLSPDFSTYSPLAPAGVVPGVSIKPTGEPLGFFTYAEQLWRTDGTAAGTFILDTPARELLRLQAATRSAHGYDLLVLTSLNTEEIWSTDGSLSGTQVRASLLTDSGNLADLPLVRAGERLFMVLPSNADGPSLWTIEDGESEVHRVHSASAFGLEGFNNDAYGLSAFGAMVYFPACDPDHGCELWMSDGTEAGTSLVHDISPGFESSNPNAFFVSSADLYFLADDNLHSNEVWVLPLDGGPACRADERRLCLESGRFQATATWRDFAGRSGDATAVPITSDTGYFWFFDEDNVELILKLIDGGGFNGHHWVYYGALSNVEYTFTVTDSETGAAKRYFNPATRFASSGDITAFGPQGAHAQGGPAEAMTRAATPPDVALAAFSAPQGLPGACVPTTTRFCILNNRFAVTATWRDFAGHTGTANAGTLTDDTGYLWFFNEANVEVVLKMVDAGAFNGHFWVYYGALSNVEYTLTVTDTVVGGPPKLYRNALGQFGSFGDIEAFPAP
jgi:ELWxxDGT repeat protein